MFRLFGYALRGENEKETISLDRESWEKIYKLSKKHDLAHLIGYALKGSENKIDEDIQKAFEQAMNMAAFRYVKISYDLETISNALEKAQIPFIPLKGSVLRNYYPEAWLRTSCDIDILVKNEDLDRTVNLLIEKYGYVFKERGLHDISLFSKNKIHLELHFDLTSEDRYTKILSTVWEECVLAENKSHQYLMSNEMFMFYHLTHMAEHFIHGGCGIRSFIDLWIIRTKMSYDEGTVLKMCEQVGLEDFYFQTQHLMKVWFESEKHTDLSIEIENFIIGAGIYGSMENNIAINQSENKGKIKYIFGRVILPYEKLKRLYPKLEKHKILIPFYQVRRWIYFIFKKNKKRAMQELKVNSYLSKDKVGSVNKLCKTLGLK